MALPITLLEASMDAKLLELVSQSYGRCCVSTGFFDTFYKIFLSKSPELGKMFEKTDMKKQKELLRDGIAFLTAFAKNSQMAARKVDSLGDSHSVGKLNVRPDMYPMWVDSLMEAVKQHDKKFDSNIEKAWRVVVGLGIQKMIERYQSTKKAA
jgi:hemoglobin-like flavoprotein